MAGIFTIALAIPEAFSDGGLPYALGLLCATAVRTYLCMTVPTGSAQAIRGIAGFNFAAALLVFAAAFVRPPWDWPLWTPKVSVLLLAAIGRRERDFQLSPAHFVERNGLLLIVALGESIVAVGLGARGLPLDVPLFLTAVVALLLSASVWWTYFARDDRLAEHQFAAVTPAERAHGAPRLRIRTLHNDRRDHLDCGRPRVGDRSTYRLP